MAHFVIYLHEANQYQVIVGHYGLNRLSYPGGPNLRFVCLHEALHTLEGGDDGGSKNSISEL